MYDDVCMYPICLLGGIPSQTLQDGEGDTSKLLESMILC